MIGRALGLMCFGAALIAVGPRAADALPAPGPAGDALRSANELTTPVTWGRRGCCGAYYYAAPGYAYQPYYAPYYAPPAAYAPPYVYVVPTPYPPYYYGYGGTPSHYYGYAGSPYYYRGPAFAPPYYRRSYRRDLYIGW